MRRLSKAMRYRALAAKQTNIAVIGLLHRLADEAERRLVAQKPPVGGTAQIIPFPVRAPLVDTGLLGIPFASRRAS